MAYWTALFTALLNLLLLVVLRRQIPVLDFHGSRSLLQPHASALCHWRRLPLLLPILLIFIPLAQKRLAYTAGLLTANLYFWGSSF